MIILKEGIQKNSDRKNIPNQIPETIDQLKKTLDELSIGLEVDEKTKVLNNLKYILEKIYFNKEKREEKYEELKNKYNVTEEEITTFLEKDSNVLISGYDWQALISTGIANWSYGESGDNIKDRIDILSTISYYSLQATLRTGIHTGLFLQNINKFFPKIKDELFEEFKNDSTLSGGLLLTELNSGSDLLSDYGTTYIENEDGTFTIEGLKHLQGLTNEASHWIVLAKNGKGRGFRLFLIDNRKEKQTVEMSEEYNIDALKSITYGKNEINATVPKENISELISKKDRLGLKTFVSMLYDSRLQFPAMMVGSIKRIYDESTYKAGLRKISGGKMEQNPVVQDQLEEIRIRHSIVDLINKYLIYSKINLFEDNTENEGLSIIAKTISTEYTISAGEIGKRLQGGLGFKEKNIISNILKDAWPFSIFEGVNEMLYSGLVKIFEKKENTGNNNIKLNDFLQINLGINLNEIKLLQVNNDIKGKIYSRLSIISMIYEMNIENEYRKELNFILNEIKSYILKATNINTKISIK